MIDLSKILAINKFTSISFLIKSFFSKSKLQDFIIRSEKIDNQNRNYLVFFITILNSIVTVSRNINPPKKTTTADLIYIFT